MVIIEDILFTFWRIDVNNGLRILLIYFSFVANLMISGKTEAVIEYQYCNISI